MDEFLANEFDDRAFGPPVPNPAIDGGLEKNLALLHELLFEEL